MSFLFSFLFLFFFISGVLCNLSTPQPSFSRAQALEINDCGATVRSPKDDLRVKCHLCESRWDMKRLARMLRRSLDL